MQNNSTIVRSSLGLVDVGLDKATIKLDDSYHQTRVKFGSRKIRLLNRADAKISTQSTKIRR